MCKLEDALNQQLLTRLDQLISILTPAKANYQKQSKLLDSAHSFIWQAHSYELKPINRPAKLPLELFTGIDSVKDILMQNSLQFAQGFSANNCLLWGARGMGKSSLIKAIHHKIVETYPLKLIEISRNDLSTLSILLDILANSQHRVILFCDDLSFEQDTQDYKALKSLLDGGLETRPQNLLFYATSNRKHLLPRQAIENEQATAINPNEAIEEKISLSDRFGLWLGFHSCSQAQYLEMIDRYIRHFALHVMDKNEIHKQALAWATTRGHRSGRVAWQFIQDLAGKHAKQLKL